MCCVCLQCHQFIFSDGLVKFPSFLKTYFRWNAAPQPPWHRSAGHSAGFNIKNILKTRWRHHISYISNKSPLQKKLFRNKDCALTNRGEAGKMCPCHRFSVPLMRTVLRMLIRGSIHEALHKRVGPARVWMVREGWVSPFILAASSRRGSLETLRLRHDAVSGRQSVYSALKVTYEPSHLQCYFCLTITDLWY